MNAMPVSDAGFFERLGARMSDPASTADAKNVWGVWGSSPRKFRKTRMAGNAISGNVGVNLAH